ncbi:hypothetical protein BK133_28325 [Paenibacillus sp. FSL H8-0548]|uniref:hypothetical protein n=1 Tax=Paenibacillus sp. FSL H8-0548 TaxID=1920422 RepID=UPI00096F5811|nr:hypothetical protein [Paenibacillus sp. FSL H8-0548]OMF21473.1 hypothetical protein BK133_28325 [Paenibacillus sp. FSL H8-0548]
MREEHGHRGRHAHRDHPEHREHRHFNKDGLKEDQHKIAQTFRRGRAIAFLDKLNVNRSTLQRQLSDPQFESIKQVISGELKATEAIIEEFIQMFQLHEIISNDTEEGNNRT